MKKILMLATYFPPAGGISTFRVTKFAKYLHEFGWEPVILTVSEECYNECNVLIDNSLLKDIPEKMSIYRTSLSGILKIFLIKDPSIRWLPPLFSSIKSVISKEKPMLLYATGDPFFPLIVARFAKLFYRLNYVIDLRDPWKLAIPTKPISGFKSRMRRVIDNIFEPIVLNNAAKIICVSEDMCQQYRDAYPDRPPEDFIVIPNGYDPDDYDTVLPKIFSEFTITYAGKFLSGKSYRNPTYFLQALKILKQRGIRITFKYVGEINNDITNIVADNGLSDQFESVGYISYHDTISYMKGSNLLLLIGSGQQTEQTGKVFDYLGCKRPILALAPKKGGIADVVSEIDQVTLIENEDPNTIAEAIEKIYMISSNSDIQRTNISKYLRKSLTFQLSTIFDEVVGTNSCNDLNYN